MNTEEIHTPRNASRPRSSRRRSEKSREAYFNELLREHARLPMDEQAAGLERALAEHRGDYDQRDDVTVLAFRVT